MHILVTNDDGIESPGLWHLAAALHKAGLGTVTIIAPSEEHSGMSMSFPPRLEHEIYPVPPPSQDYADIPAYALTGTPVGCVTAGMLAAVGPAPTVVVAGINRGLNSGTNVMLSGTVGAAMVGAFWGVPAMAVSAQVVRDTPMSWESAAWAATCVFPLLIDTRPEPHPLVLNVNVPNIPDPGMLRGFRQTILSNFFYGRFIGLSELLPGERGGQRFRYTFDRSRLPGDFDELTDDGAIRAGYVSVTALTPMTVHPNVDLSSKLASLH